jgi:hypothetical protein
LAINEKIIRHQKLWLLAIVLVIIILSVISTLWFRGFFPPSGHTQGYRNITLTDAVITCENEIREAHKQRLRHLTLDNLSSRFDEKTNFFRVFFVADLQVAKEAGAPSTPFLVSCFVGATRGDIKGIELFEKKESTTEPIQKRDGGIFGWPL